MEISSFPIKLTISCSLFLYITDKLAIRCLENASIVDLVIGIWTSVPTLINKLHLFIYVGTLLHSNGPEIHAHMQFVSINYICCTSRSYRILTNFCCRVAPANTRNKGRMLR